MADRNRVFGRVLLGALLTTALSLPAIAAAALQASTPQVTDPVGDANGSENISGSRDTRPASYDPADIVDVALETEFTSTPVGDDGIDYEPTALLIRIRTVAPPKSDGPTITYILTSSVGGCSGRFKASIHGPLPLAVDPPDRVLQWNELGQNCPDGASTVSHPSWSAVVESGTFAWRIPFASLTPEQTDFIAPGKTITQPRAFTQTFFAGFASFGSIVPGRIDKTANGIEFVIGSDVPEDILCTSGCP